MPSSHYSSWHSARLFKLLTGLAPAEYVRRLKLTQSALRLRDEECKVIEVANSLSFGSVDGYQRVFYRKYGCNLRTHAQDPRAAFFVPPLRCKVFEPLEGGHIDGINELRLHSAFGQAEKKGHHQTWSKGDRFFSYCQEVGCEVWGVLTSIRSILGEPVGLCLPDVMRKSERSTYVQGVEADHDYQGALPEGYDLIDLPRTSYLMFQGEPFKEEEYCEAIVTLHKAMDRYDPKVIGFSWDNEQPSIQLEPIGTRGYIEMRAVKPLKGTTGPMSYTLE